MSDLAQMLDQLREEAGSPSLRDLAARTDINRTSLSEYISGKRAPSASVLRQIVQALGGDTAKFERSRLAAAEKAVGTTEQESINCFLSYTRTDNEQLAFVDEFKKSVEYYARANRGRKIDMWVDTSAIEWGADWAEKIHDGVLGATVFVPIVTLEYFQSDWCRREFLTFYENATTLGVTELLLPVIIFGHRSISLDSDDEVARVIASRQYIDLQAAFLEGHGSPTWRRTMLGVADSLVDSVESAESRLPAATSELEMHSQQDPKDALDGLSEEQAGLSELVEQANELSPRIPQLAESYGSDVNQVGVILSEFNPPGEWNGQVFTRLALQLKPICERAAETGKELENTCVEADSVLRQASNLMQMAGFEEARTGLAASFAEIDSSQLVQAEVEMDKFLTNLKAAEVLSVPLRKAVRPLRNSVRSVRVAAQTIGSWNSIFGE